MANLIIDDELQFCLSFRLDLLPDLDELIDIFDPFHERGCIIAFHLALYS